MTASTSRAGEPSYTVDASSHVEGAATDCTWTVALVTTNPFVDTGIACAGATRAGSIDMRNTASPQITGTAARLLKGDPPCLPSYE